MKAVAYIRTSTKDQLAMYGPDRQREAIRSWARQHRHRIVAEVVEATSGTVPPPARTLWPYAVETACENGGAVVVADLSRLSRDLIEQETALREMARCGTRLCSTSEEEQRMLDDPNDPQRKLIRQVVGAVNEYDRSQIVRRMQDGRRLKKQAGGYAGGQPPFGYKGRDKSKELVPHPAEQAVLSRMRDLHAAGASTRAIADVLNREGMTTRQDGRWSSPMVSHHLRAPVREAGSTQQR
ncbi:recombinase family protein [Nocardia sp. 348MFTsu5.1]|uniref:recombinase family protein n=1 Tax=Nocardia sp. 348MFTsu5.1 TaxID=1172185 RepID=UPI0003817CE6|nr:recombinase family protein [Nocardia sp. 348MFTsu5.1]